MSEYPWTLAALSVSAFIFSAAFFDGGIICVVVGTVLAFVGLILLYFEDKPADETALKGRTFRRFLAGWFAGGKGLLVSMGIYAIIVLCFCGVHVLINSCTERPPYPYHNAETGRGQYDYGGSREQQRDLERIDDYIKNHPDE